MFEAKLVVLGDSGVGKTCILERIKNGTFSDFPSTISNQSSFFNYSVDKTDIQFDLCDTAGQELYQSLSLAYARDADITFLVFDIGDEMTMFNLKNWLELAIDVNADNIVYFIGSKCDIEENDKEVTKEEVIRFIDSLEFDKKIKYCEVSAKSGENIPELIHAAAKDFLKYGCSENKSQISVSSVYIIGPSEQKNPEKKKCCK